MPGDPPTGQQLVHFQVKGLLGRFNYDISFDPTWQFLILHGPNGIGKTRLLEVIHSVLSGRYIMLTTIPFRRARLVFNDESWIEMGRAEAVEPDRSHKNSGHHGTHTLLTDRLVWKIGHGPETLHYGELAVPAGLEDDRLISRLVRQHSVGQVDVDSWIDYSTGELVSYYELLERYSPSLPPKYRPAPAPEPITSFLSQHNVHLIETQRLLDQTHGSNRHRIVRSRIPQQRTVVSFAHDLVQKLDSALARNSRRSQSLDRSFPSRLFKAAETSDSEEQLRSLYDEQQQLRSRLAKIAILDSSPDLHLPERGLERWERLVLRTYLDDTSAKLETFQPLLKRLELMTNIVNRKFLFKHLVIDREEGFVLTDKDSGRKVDLPQLSSGEQHELVLLYDLLMNVPESSLVLIDEPEISLHVAWQKSFLDDLDQIASLTALRFVVATHSPQIIGRWWDRALELYSTR